MEIEINNTEHDILSCLIENEINSNINYLDDNQYPPKSKEKEFWENSILELKNILIKFKQIEVCVI